jgi:hypothetical protein
VIPLQSPVLVRFGAKGLMWLARSKNPKDDAESDGVNPSILSLLFPPMSRFTPTIMKLSTAVSDADAVLIAEDKTTMPKMLMDSIAL